MELPENLYDEGLYEQLRTFRDTALVESHWLGRRWQLGSFTFGKVQAAWQTEEGGRAFLTDEGLRFKKYPVTKFYPTTLQLHEEHGDVGTEVVSFEMDLDDIGFVEVYRNAYVRYTVLEHAKGRWARRSDEKYGLTYLERDDRELLYTEMQRGASGLYGLA